MFCFVSSFHVLFTIFHYFGHIFLKVKSLWILTATSFQLLAVVNELEINFIFIPYLNVFCSTIFTLENDLRYEKYFDAGIVFLDIKLDLPSQKKTKIITLANSGTTQNLAKWIQCWFLSPRKKIIILLSRRWKVGFKGDIFYSLYLYYS